MNDPLRPVQIKSNDSGSLGAIVYIELSVFRKRQFNRVTRLHSGQRYMDHKLPLSARLHKLHEFNAIRTHSGKIFWFT